MAFEWLSQLLNAPITSELLGNSGIPAASGTPSPNPLQPQPGLDLRPTPTPTALDSIPAASGAIAGNPLNPPSIVGNVGPDSSAPPPTPAPVPAVPLPQPRPLIPAQSAPPLPPPSTITPAPSVASPALATAAPRLGLSTTSLGPPPAASFGAPPPTAAGGLAAQLGINPNMLRSALGGLGQGLSAIGNQKPGTTAGAAFAGGMGGALQGTEKTKQAVTRELDTAFKDMQAAKAANDVQAYDAARTNYFNARARSLDLGQSAGGSRAYQNTPWGRFDMAERRVTAFETPRRKSIDVAVRSGQLLPNDAQKAYDDLDKRVQQFRQNVYRGLNVDPQEAGGFKKMDGETRNTAFDTKGMTLNDFNRVVPLGAFYKDQNGVLRQRTEPASSPTPPSAPRAPQATYDDMTAMQPAA